MPKNKDDNSFIDTSKMTLKPKRKRKRKGKSTNLQTLYNEGKVTSEEFYKELIIFIKWRLMTDLIKRGYYINGVRQLSFTRDECDDCYTHVLNKILTSYRPEDGTLATYVRWQIRGWGQLVIQKQVKEYKYLPEGFVSLDSNKIYNIKLEDYENNCKNPEEMDILLDMDFFGDNQIESITKDDVVDIREGIKEFSTETWGLFVTEEDIKGDLI